LGGNVFRKWFTYAVQVEAAGGNANLLDMYFNFTYDIRFSPEPDNTKYLLAENSLLQLQTFSL